jgi:TPR repeat protein
LITACGESGDPKALFDKGEYTKAYKQWQPLANNGDLTAQNYIGIHHYLGLGIQRNHKIAKEWFEKAAVNGFADAQYNLAVMYENGEFVKQDYVTAYMWFYLANQNGNTNAPKRMQALAEEHKLFPNQMNRALELAKEYLHNN